MKYYGIFFLLFLFMGVEPIYSQQTIDVNFEDGFEDGDFSSNPTWSGDINQFKIDTLANNQLLRLNSSGDDVSFLSVPSTQVVGSWEFYIKLDFNPSGSNYAEVFLMSDIANLEGNVNGYALLAGESGSNDVFRLVRYDNGSQPVTILSGTTDISSGGGYRVKIVRTTDGNWTLQVGTGYDGALQLESTGTDNTYSSAQYFGVKTTYTSSRSNKFYFDFKIDLPPFTITDASASGSSVTVTFNHPYNQTTVQSADFTIDPDIGSVQDINFISSKSVQLQYTSSFPSDKYTLSVNTIKDQSGQTIANNSTTNFTVYAPFSPGDVVINEFMYDPPSGQSEYVELKNTSNKYLNLQGWKLSDSTGPNVISNVVLTLSPNSFLVISNDTTALYNTYGDKHYFEMSNLPSLNNGGDLLVIFTDGGIKVDSLHYASNWGVDEVALERRSPAAPPIRANFGPSSNPLGGTPGSTNEVASDTTPPDLIDLTIVDDQTLELAFSEMIQTTGAGNENNFVIDHGISVNSAVKIAIDSVRLTLSSPLQNGITYQLNINNQTDIFGNAIPLDTSFTYFEISPVGTDDIYINEFMYSPPSGQTEYIEVYNPTGKSLNLQGWTLSDNTGNTSTITSTKTILPPNSYVVLAPDGTLLNQYPNIQLITMGSNFPSLNNSGDAIIIKDPNGMMLDSLTYNNSWGGNQIALERRSVDIPPVKVNFGESPNGFGTPGNANQIAPDTTPPALAAFVIVNNQTLEMVFSESLASASVTDISNYSITGSLSVANITLSVDTVRLTLSSPMQNNSIYTVTISNIADLFSNTATVDTTFTYLNPSPVDQDDIYINEFMVEPPNGQTEYIELYNASSKSLNLQGWTLNDNGDQPSIIINQPFIIPPKSYIVLAPDGTLLSRNPTITLIEMGSAFPSFNNSGDAIVITDSTGTVLDSLAYDDSWGGNNIALERRTIQAPPLSSNFGNAPNGFGTPGRVNTIKADTMAPKLKQLTIKDAQHLKLEFNEPLQKSTVTKNNFQIGSSLQIAAVDLNRKTITLTLSNKLKNATNYHLNASNITDIFGNQASFDTTFIYYHPSPVGTDDIYITEFMYDPPSGQTEYIELYNPTDQSFNLKGWQLNDNTGNATSITYTNTIIPPDGYIVLAPDKTLLTNYPNIMLVTMEARFPSLNNSGDAITITDSTGTILASLRYNQNWDGHNTALERRSIDVSPIQANFGKGESPGSPNTIAADTLAPVLTSFTINNDQELTFIFNEPLAPSQATNTDNYHITGRTSISTVHLSGDTIHLLLATSMKNNKRYTVTADSLADVFGNTLSFDTSFVFLRASPVDKNNIYINEFMFDPPSGQTEYIELYNPTDKSFNLKGWTLNDNSGSPSIITNNQFIIPPNSYVVLAPDRTLQDSLPAIMLIPMKSGFPSLNNTGDAIVVSDSTGQLLDSLKYTDDWSVHGTALERRTISVAPIKPNFGEAPNGFGSPGRKNDITNDTIPPKLQQVVILSNQSLKLIFSEYLDKTIAGKRSNYSINHNISISNVLVDTQTVILKLKNKLKNNVAYTLDISNITDLFGNKARNQQKKFTYYHTTPVTADDIFITEFMVDPPSGQTEYVELFNPTDKSFNLKSWTFNDNSGEPATITNESFILPPNSYVVLAPDRTLQDSLPDIALIAMQSSFSSLNNSGDAIIIADSSGQVLDSLRYDDSWGGHETALERRTIEVPAINANFGEAPNGFGSPGMPNNIAPDTSPPHLTAFSIRDSQHLTFIFNETLQPVANPKKYFSITDNVGIQSVSFKDKTINIALESKLQNAATYTFTANKILDIFDNSTSIDTTFVFYQTSTVDASAVFITEFMYNPPEGQAEYIELYNSTDKSYDMQGWMLNDNSGEASVIIEKQIILPPNGYVVLAPDRTLLSTYPDISLIAMGPHFPSLNNSGDAIIITDSTGAVLDSLNYDDSWGGHDVALERRSIKIAPVKANFGNAPNNFGTPGAPNNIKADTTAPTLTAFIVANSRRLTFIFNEALSSSSATVKSNYAISGDLSIVSIQHSQNKVAIDLSDSMTNNTTYTIAAHGLTDIFGNDVSVDTTFIFLDASPVETDDIFINEFMYHPPEGQTEYVELYNPTNQSFNLKGWMINDSSGDPTVITDTQYLLPPDSYVILAPDQTLLKTVPDIHLIALGGDFPSFNNSGDVIVIADSTGAVLDSLRYNRSWDGTDIALERRTVRVAALNPNFGEAPNGFGTPGSKNLIKPDKAPPTLKNITIINNETIQLQFSELIKRSVAASKNNYKLSPAIKIQDIELHKSVITLQLNQPLVSDKTYQLMIKNLKDIFDNEMTTVTQPIVYVQIDEAKPKAIIINEFLVNGEPEFVELYNRSDKNIDLSGWQIGDSNNTAVIESNSKSHKNSLSIDQTLILHPGQYLVITESEILAQKLHNGIYLSNLPAFNDDRDIIYIKNDHDITIDSLFYTPAFGSNIEGESAERKDPDAASNDPFNWETSTSKKPYSAGIKNTIYQPDKKAPQIVFATITTNNNVEVVFNEFIQLTPKIKFSINNRTVQVASFDSTNGNSIVLKTPNLSPGEALAVTAAHVSDVSGNITPSTKLPVAQPLTKGDVVINEILFDPIDDSDDEQVDQREFIELYNTRDYAISLENLYLHNAPDENGAVDRLTPVSTDRKWIPPGGTAVIYAGQKREFSKTEFARFFALKQPVPYILLRVNAHTLSLSSSGDAIYLTNAEGATIDSVFYRESWHNPNLIDTDGISLERINPNGASNTSANWGSSTAPKGGTPAAENTLYQKSVKVEKKVGIQFSSNPFSPDGDGYEDHLIISYRLNKPDYLMTVRIYDRYGRFIIELADSKPAGLKGTIMWNGRKENGGRNRIGIYIVIFRAFDSTNGEDLAFKETVVIARRLH